MEIEKAINDLKERLYTIYESTEAPLKENIHRGHLRSISADIEDGIALFISAILPKEYSFLIDCSVKVRNETHRPDLLIIDRNSKVVVAMIEIKANMGYCRNATDVINKMKENHKEFYEKEILNCSFSTGGPIDVRYNNNTLLFLLSFTSANCSDKAHKKNKERAKAAGVQFFNLFSDWYDILNENEICDFVNELKPLL